MNDRIKFKAYHKPTNKIFDVYGFNEHFVFEDTIDGIETSETNPANREDCILLQCTGLKDKNGKLIYDGYIVQTKEFGKAKDNAVFLDFDIFEVYFSYGAFRIKNKHGGYFNLCISKKLEIIGNIHENPELLEA